MVLRKIHSTALIALLWAIWGFSQYAPQAGLAGSTAVPADSPELKYWVTAAQLTRGYVNIADTTQTAQGSNRVSFGTVQAVYGEPQGVMDVVSLGDRGMILLSFDVDISDGPGWDFAVFENGFRSLTDSNLAFLELAFVEVSSDGKRFFRFPAVSLTPTDRQVGSFEMLDARKIHNLAGKYIAGYGTPFDLSDLDSCRAEGLDLEHVRFIRLIDVVGSIDSAYASRDSRGNIINDPFPTPFASGGFDLDAVGVRHFSVPQSQVRLYPNPAIDFINVISNSPVQSIELFSLSGKKVKIWRPNAKFSKISLQNLNQGVYLCVIKSGNKIIFDKIIKL